MPDQDDPIAEKLPANKEYRSPAPWEDAREVLENGEWYWLATVHPRRRPHVRPVLAVWLDGALYSSSNANARKRRNIDANPSCSVSLMTDEVHLVLEGEAVRVNNETLMRRVADVYATKYDWHVTVRDGLFDAEYGAPTAGPPPYELYQITPRTVFAFGLTESFSPTRWRFS